MCSSSRLLTCPYHRSRLSCSFLTIGATFMVDRIVSFVTWSSIVTPIVHRSIRVSITPSFRSSLRVLGQHSPPYNAVGRITVRYICDFSFSGSRLSHRIPVRLLHFIQAAFIRPFISSWSEPSADMQLPKYLNDVVFLIAVSASLIVPGV